MFIQILDFLGDGVKQCFDWFNEIFDAINGAWDFYIAVFLIFIAVKFLIMPILGGRVDLSGRSDTVQKPDVSSAPRLKARNK